MGSKTKRDLIIGSTSQVAQFFNQNTVRCPSRNIDDKIFLENWNRVYVCFAEQRTSLSEQVEFKQFFYDVNFHKTKMVVDKIKAETIIFLSTTELWNLCSGPIDLDVDYNFRQNYYTDSKLMITQELMERENVIIAYPFNFNSKFRSKYFLFGKIYNGIVNKEKIELGNIDFRRDLMHAKYVSKQLEKASKNIIIGTGRLTHVGNFIKDLYRHAGLDYYKYVFHPNVNSQNNRVENWNATISTNYGYNQLILDTITEMK